MLCSKYDYILNFVRDKNEVKSRVEFITQLRQMFKDSNESLRLRRDSINSVRDSSLETLKPFRL